MHDPADSLSETEPDTNGVNRSDSAERLRVLVENLPDMIVTLDSHGTIRFINRTLPEYTVEQVTGTSALDYLEEPNIASRRPSTKSSARDAPAHWRSRPQDPRGF